MKRYKCPPSPYSYSLSNAAHRFLGNELARPKSGATSKACWRTASDDTLEQRGKLTSWVIRKARGVVEAERSEEDEMSEYSRRTYNFVRCGDVVYLESFSNPGWFIKPKNGVNVSGWGREDAAVQVVAPSLRFAIKLGERTSMYRAAAVSARNAKSQGQERRKRLLKVIKEAKEQKRIEQDLNNIFPVDVIRHILGFFEGIVSSVSCPDFKELEPHKQQSLVDCLPISKRKESVRHLRKAREVCKLWEEIGSYYIKGMKAGEMLESGRGMKRYLLDRVDKFSNLVSLDLRNMDSLLDSDIKVLCPKLEEVSSENDAGREERSDKALNSTSAHFARL